MALKGLFGKLVKEYGDDAAKLIATKGDDVARAAAAKGDDVLRAADKVDDFLPDRSFEFTNPFGQVVSADYGKPGVWDIGGKTFHDVPKDSLLTNQSVLKEELLNKRTGREYLNSIPREGSDVKFLGDATQLFDYNNREMFNRGNGFTTALPYRMPSEDLVYDYTTLRPHNNTALGRWYADKVADFESLSANAPDFDYGTYLDDHYKRAPEARHFLDTRDAVNRVQSDIGRTGTARGLNTQDLLTYTDNLSDLERYDVREPMLVDVYDELRRRYDTSKKLQGRFGSVPSTFPSDQTFERALSDLFTRIEDLPY